MTLSRPGELAFLNGAFNPLQVEWIDPGEMGVFCNMGKWTGWDGIGRQIPDVGWALKKSLFSEGNIFNVIYFSTNKGLLFRTKLSILHFEFRSRI